MTRTDPTRRCRHILWAHSLVGLLVGTGCGELFLVDQDGAVVDSGDSSAIDGGDSGASFDGGDSDSSTPPFDSGPPLDSGPPPPESCTPADTSWPDALGDGSDNDLDGRIDEGCGLFGVAWVESPTNMLNTSSVDAFDFDGDGWMDVTWTATGVPAPPPAPSETAHRFYRATGPFEFEPAFTDIVIGSALDGHWIDILDLPGPEFVISRSGPNEVWNLSDGALERVWESVLHFSHGPILAADFDQDGHTDLVFPTWLGDTTVDTEVYRNLEATVPGTFSNPRIRLPDGLDGAFGDLDGDSLPDLALIQTTNNAVVIYEFVGYETDLEFVDLQTIPFDAMVTGSVLTVAWGDYDGDEDEDLLVGTGDLFLFSNEAGTLVADGTLPPSFGTPSAIELVDLNHDDRLDIVVAAGVPTGATVYLQSAAGGFPSSPSWYSPIVARFSDVSVADFDGDGWSDLAFCAQMQDFPAENRIYRNLIPGPAIE